MTQSQTWFPGRDYPDREVWLKLRAPRVSRVARTIHDSGEKGPLRLGINEAKRQARRAEKNASFGTHRQLVRTRHYYYAKRADASARELGKEPDRAAPTLPR